MTQASVLTRLREGDIRAVPVAVWPFLILLIAAVVLPLEMRQLPFTLQTLLQVAVAAAPLAFATAVASTAPIDRRFLVAATAIAVPEILRVAQLLGQRLNLLTDFDWIGFPLNLTWLLTVGGLVLLGIALGGLGSRIGWAAVAVGVVWFVIDDIQIAQYWAANPLSPDISLPPEMVPLSFLGGLVTVAWAFLLGVGLEHGYRAIALGAGITVAIAYYSLIVLPLLLPEPGTGDLSLLNLGSTVVRLCAWLAH